MRRYVVPWIAALAAIILTAGCSREAVQPAPAETPVFIISIDTLRSDHLSAYGYKSATQPSIDAFRKEAILFESAFSQGPQTLVAHASMFTGLIPPGHGVRDNLGYVLKSEHPTLASILASHGYATGAAVSTYVLRKATNVGSGFAFYDDALDYGLTAVKNHAERDGDRSRQALERWLQQTPQRRVFGFLHLYEPHAPYLPPPEYRKHRDPYDDEIGYADEIVGRFLTTLRAAGLYDNALIIITSDHGEGLGDHGEDEHGVFLYREAIQIPLLVKLPGNRRAGETVTAPVSLVDLAPTVLAVAGIESSVRFDGRDLIATAIPDRVIYSESYFARLHFGWHHLRSGIGRDLHYIEAPTKELYRYREDPGERTNVAESFRRELFALQEQIGGIDERFAPPAAIDPEDQRRLASLGYLGGGSTASGDLPDPKTKAGVLRDLRRAVDQLHRGNTAEAVRRLTTFTNENPDIVDGFTYLAQALMTDRPAEAVGVLQRGLKQHPESSTLAFATAELLLRQQRFDDAKAHAELTLKSDPVLTHELLGRIAMSRGTWSDAERELRAALALAPQRSDTLKLLADTLLKQDRRAEEVELLDRAQREVESRSLPPIAGLNFQRGEAHLSLRRVADAEQSFRKETTYFPGNRQAWGSLALVVGAQGRREEARQILLSATNQNRDERMLKIALECFEIMSDPAGAELVRKQMRGAA
ncbi:MAG: sulfatase-like hydrolase/transferase [Acidobacteriota bacterium]|nr:sulfatase-like hydrolase/transferase [Acidobacteriota bacterium]